MQPNGSDNHPVAAGQPDPQHACTSGGKGRRNGTWTISASGKHRHRIGPPRASLSWQPLPAG